MEPRLEEKRNGGSAQEVLLPPPLIKNYRCYRAFLRDWYLYRKQLRPGFSYRRFSAMLGLKSPNFLQLVIKGQRNLSVEMGERLAKLMHLAQPERQYLLALLQIETARGEKARAEAEKFRLAALRKLVTTPFTKLQEKMLSRWHHMLVRELVFLPDFEPSGAYISRQLNHLISPEEAEESLQILLKLGFLRKSANGKLEAADPVIDTGDEIFTHQCMQKHHGETLVTWGKNLAKLDAAELELGLLHIPVAAEKLPELKRRIRQFQDEIIGWLQDEKKPDRVVQLGTYLIPFQEIEKEK
jgi:uncharacterized protein (TIGR02147 family)